MSDISSSRNLQERTASPAARADRESRLVVLSLCDWYFPGFKAAGPARSISSMATLLGDRCDFLILTRDRDRGDECRYDGLRQDGDWHDVRSTRVKYFAPSRYGWIGSLQLVSVLRAIDYDVLYLNSVFSFEFSIAVMLLRRLGLLKQTPTIVAPRGELASAAIMSHSRWKKRVYLLIARLAGLYKGVLWHASTDNEAREITDVFASGELHVARDLATRVHVARNLSLHQGAQTAASTRRKQVGELRMVFFSRIARKKNLLFALDVLSRSSGRITCDIYGPIEDQSYWAECEAVVRRMPSNVIVRYLGSIEPGAVDNMLQSYHVYFLPTLNENFGHTLFEALSAGCVIITSTETPWRDLLAQDVGWDLPLSQPEEFESAIATCVAMKPDEFDRMSRAASALGRVRGADDESLESNRRLFARAVREA